MPSALYEQLTQKLPRVLQPRFPQNIFENGVLIPTEFDLQAGVRNISYETYNYVGDASVVSDSDEGVPIVDVTSTLDTYPVYMVMSGFPISFQLSRSYNAINTIASRDVQQNVMLATRQVISQRIDRATALGLPNLNFQGFATNSAIDDVDSSFDINTATYDDARNFFVSMIQSLTRNEVTSLPTDIVLTPIYYEKMMGLASANDKVLVTHIRELYPNIRFHQTNKVSASNIDAAITRPVGQQGKDRIVLYPREDRVLHRHLESQIAQLAPEEYSRVADVGGVLSKIFFMFSCVTPCIFDFPNDVRYYDVVAAT